MFFEVHPGGLNHIEHQFTLSFGFIHGTFHTECIAGIGKNNTGYQAQDSNNNDKSDSNAHLISFFLWFFRLQSFVSTTTQ